MLRPTLQLLAAIPCVALLWVLWRVSTKRSHLIGRLITVGFLIRAFLGSLLFWISYLALSPGKSLQLGNGFWFFGLDSVYYHGEAVRLASSGLLPILFESKSVPSVVFVQTMALFSLAFGSSPAVGLLLNLVCYLGACLILTALRAQTQAQKTAKLLAVAAISLSPGAMVWALQPLKDSYFVFLIVAFVAGCLLWQRAWKSGDYGTAATAALILVGTMYALAGIRWYVAFAQLVGLTLFFVLVVAFARRRAVAAVAALGTFYVLSVAFISAGGPYIPGPIQAMLSPSTAIHQISTLPSFLTRSIENARSGFDRSGGATLIAEGTTLKTLHPDTTPPASTPPAVVPVPVKTAGASEQPGPPPTVVIAPDTRQASPAEQPEPSSSPSEAIDLPSSRTTRILTGVAALTIPRGVAQRLGILRIGGGRGMWMFADLDTIVFDVVVLSVLWFLFRFTRQSFSSPAFWMLMLLVPCILVPLLYSVSNFGTLFRLREIIYIFVTMTPIAAAFAASEPAVSLRGGLEPPAVESTVA